MGLTGSRLCGMLVLSVLVLRKPLDAGPVIFGLAEHTENGRLCESVS